MGATCNLNRITSHTTFQAFLMALLKLHPFVCTKISQASSKAAQGSRRLGQPCRLCLASLQSLPGSQGGKGSHQAFLRQDY